MTFDHEEPWISYADLLLKAPGERIKYVRTNLRHSGEKRSVNQDDFAAAVGATSGRQATIRWEAGAEPREFAASIAALTPYPAAAFLQDAAEGVSLATIDLRLRALEAKVDGMAQATAESLAHLGAAIDELSDRLPAAKPGSQRRKATR